MCVWVLMVDCVDEVLRGDAKLLWLGRSRFGEVVQSPNGEKSPVAGQKGRSLMPSGGLGSESYGRPDAQRWAGQ